MRHLMTIAATLASAMFICAGATYAGELTVNIDRRIPYTENVPRLERPAQIANYIYRMIERKEEKVRELIILRAIEMEILKKGSGK